MSLPAHADRPPRVLVVVNVDWYFWSHRLPLARRLRAAGYDVVIVAGEERGYRPRIEAEGFRFVPLPLQRASTNPWQEVKTCLALVRIYRAERPDLVHHVSIKPVLYGSLAARLAGRPAVVNAVTGLGYTFLPSVRRSRLGRLTRALYRLACSGPRTVMLFQNPDDRAALVDAGLAPPERCVVVRGSGVDVEQFRPRPRPPGVPVVLLAGRMLWDKGVGVFVEAARQLRARGVAHRAVLVGIPDEQNPNAVPEATLRQWHDEGTVEWWGLKADMPAVLGEASLVVLPTTYPEGVPKILIEAAASGRAIVATDVPGCREIARDGVNATLVPANDPAAVAGAVAALLADQARLDAYGAAGRALAVEGFVESRVLDETLAVYGRLIGRSAGAPA